MPELDLQVLALNGEGRFRRYNAGMLVLFFVVGLNFLLIFIRVFVIVIIVVENIAFKAAFRITIKLIKGTCMDPFEMDYN